MINLTFLKTFTGGDEEKMAKYINIFLQSAPVACAKISGASARGDYKALQVAVHSMKPQLKFMGLESLSAEAANIENAASAGNADATVVNKFIEDVKAAMQELENEITVMQKK